jgi:hypothetical protein
VKPTIIATMVIIAALKSPCQNLGPTGSGSSPPSIVIVFHTLLDLLVDEPPAIDRDRKGRRLPIPTPFRRITREVVGISILWVEPAADHLSNDPTLAANEETQPRIEEEHMTPTPDIAAVVLRIVGIFTSVDGFTSQAEDTRELVILSAQVLGMKILYGNEVYASHGKPARDC